MKHTFVFENYVPKPKARPRKGKNGHFYSPSSAEENVLANLAWLQKHETGMETITENVFVSIIIESKKKLKGDTDNYVKFVFDALEKAQIVKNDKQIKSFFFFCEEGAQNDKLSVFIRTETETDLLKKMLEMLKKG